MWYAGTQTIDREIRRKFEKLFNDACNEHKLHWAESAASIWEIVIKNALGRSDFRVSPVRLYEGL